MTIYEEITNVGNLRNLNKHNRNKPLNIFTKKNKTK